MIALIQRVTQASVTIDAELVSEIGAGLLVLLGVQKDDTAAVAGRLAERVAGYRVFEDEAGKMNRSLSQTGGQLLVVSQFTLAADTRKGARPSFSSAASPGLGEACYEDFVKACADSVSVVKTGRFGADMQVALVNDGPVTFWLEQH